MSVDRSNRSSNDGLIAVSIFLGAIFSGFVVYWAFSFIQRFLLSTPDNIVCTSPGFAFSGMNFFVILLCIGFTSGPILKYNQHTLMFRIVFIPVLIAFVYATFFGFQNYLIITQEKLVYRAQDVDNPIIVTSKEYLRSDVVSAKKKGMGTLLVFRDGRSIDTMNQLSGCNDLYLTLGVTESMSHVSE